MDRADRYLRRLETLFEGLAGLALFLMMASISIDAIGRYAFNSPFQGNYEITSLYLMVIVTFLMLSPTYRRRGHIRIDMVAERLERRFGRAYRRLLTLLILAAVAPFCTFAASRSQRSRTRCSAVT